MERAAELAGDIAEVRVVIEVNGFRHGTYSLGYESLFYRAFIQKRPGECGDVLDDVTMAGAGMFGKVGILIVGFVKLAGHLEGHGVVVMGVENDEAGVFEAGDAFAVGKVGPDPGGETAKEGV